LAACGTAPAVLQACLRWHAVLSCASCAVPQAPQAKLAPQAQLLACSATAHF